MGYEISDALGNSYLYYKFKKCTTIKQNSFNLYIILPPLIIQKYLKKKENEFKTLKCISRLPSRLTSQISHLIVYV